MNLAPITVQQFNEGQEYARAVNALFISELAAEAKKRRVARKALAIAHMWLDRHKLSGAEIEPPFRCHFGISQRSRQVS